MQYKRILLKKYMNGMINVYASTIKKKWLNYELKNIVLIEFLNYK